MFSDLTIIKPLRLLLSGCLLSSTELTINASGQSYKSVQMELACLLVWYEELTSSQDTQLCKECKYCSVWLLECMATRVYGY